jgi:hypothetical protein
MSCYLPANQKLPTNLRSFGEIGFVTTKTNFQSKLKNGRNTLYVFGYSVHHENDL